MNYESLGACGTAASYDGRAIAELELGIAFLTTYVGEPPPGCRLQIVEHDHELGEYGTIGLCWDIGSLGENEWRYYRRCERALSQLDAAVNWSALAAALWIEEDEPEDEGSGIDDSENEDPF